MYQLLQVQQLSRLLFIIECFVFISFQRWEKHENTKENFPLDSHNILPEEPTRKPVSARLMDWQRKAKENNTGPPALRQMANKREDFHVDRSRKALSSALEKSAPCPAPRSVAKSDSSDPLFSDVGESLDRAKGDI